DRLLELEACVTYNDPHLPQLPVSRRHPRVPAMDSRPLDGRYLQGQDCVLVVTDHSAYDWPWIVEHAPLIIDTRNATCGVTHNRERIARACAGPGHAAGAGPALISLEANRTRQGARLDRVLVHPPERRTCVDLSRAPLHNAARRPRKRRIGTWRGCR